MLQSHVYDLTVEDGDIDTANLLVTDAIVEATKIAILQTGNGRGSVAINRNLIGTMK